MVKNLTEDMVFGTEAQSALWLDPHWLTIVVILIISKHPAVTGWFFVRPLGPAAGKSPRHALIGHAGLAFASSTKDNVADLIFSLSRQHMVQVLNHCLSSLFFIAATAAISLVVNADLSSIAIAAPSLPDNSISVGFSLHPNLVLAMKIMAVVSPFIAF